VGGCEFAPNGWIGVGGRTAAYRPVVLGTGQSVVGPRNGRGRSATFSVGRVPMTQTATHGVGNRKAAFEHRGRRAAFMDTVLSCSMSP